MQVDTATDFEIPGYEPISFISDDGSIRLIRRIDSGTRLVIKFLEKHHDPVLPKRFDRKRRLLERTIKADPGFVELVEIGVSRSGCDYIITPHFPIGSLEDQLQHGPMPWHRASKLVAKTAQIVASIHSQGLALGGIRPSTIFLRDSESPIVAAFGMATRRFDDGSPSYSALGIDKNSDHTPASDVFSLALVLSALVIGRGKPQSEPMEQFLSHVQSAVPVRVFTIIQQGLAPDSGRYPDCGEFAHALLTALDSDPDDFSVAQNQMNIRNNADGNHPSPTLNAPAIDDISFTSATVDQNSSTAENPIVTISGENDPLLPDLSDITFVTSTANGSEVVKSGGVSDLADVDDSTATSVSRETDDGEKTEDGSDDSSATIGRSELLMLLEATTSGNSSSDTSVNGEMPDLAATVGSASPAHTQVDLVEHDAEHLLADFNSESGEDHTLLHLEVAKIDDVNFPVETTSNETPAPAEPPTLPAMAGTAPLSVSPRSPSPYDSGLVRPHRDQRFGFSESEMADLATTVVIFWHRSRRSLATFAAVLGIAVIAAVAAYYVIAELAVSPQTRVETVPITATVDVPITVDPQEGIFDAPGIPQGQSTISSPLPTRPVPTARATSSTALSPDSTTKPSGPLTPSGTGTSTAPATTSKPTTTDKPATTDSPPTTDKPITTNKPPTTDKPTTTNKPPTTDKPTTTNKPPTTDKPITTNKPPATDKPITTAKPLTPRR